MRTFVTECKEVEFSAKTWQTSREAAKLGGAQRSQATKSERAARWSTKG